MWTWQCGGQWGDGATVSFNVVNSPAFSSSLAIPFFVPGHLIAALIYSSTRLPLPIYWYFMKITPLNRVNVCLFFPFSSLPTPLLMGSSKLCGVPCINFGNTRRHFPKSTKRGEAREWEAITALASKPRDHLFGIFNHQNGWHDAMYTTVLWWGSLVGHKGTK